MSPGPSPRVRGAVGGKLAVLGELGTIPACAGSSHLAMHPRRGSQDHPRVCGEQIAEREGVGGVTGPSPRVRGAGHSQAPHSPQVGTIPAGAGSGGRRTCRACCCWGHPCGCGERAATPISPRSSGAAACGEQREVVWSAAGTRSYPYRCGRRRPRKGSQLSEERRRAIVDGAIAQIQRAGWKRCYETLRVSPIGRELPAKR